MAAAAPRASGEAMAITIQYERPVSHAAHWARRLALLSCLLFVAVVLSHRFGPLTTPHFLVLAGFAAAMAALAVLLAVIGLARLWQVGARGGKASFMALLLSLRDERRLGRYRGGRKATTRIFDAKRKPARARRVRHASL